MATNTVIKPDQSIDITLLTDPEIFQAQKVLIIGQSLVGSAADNEALIENVTTGPLGFLFSDRSMLTNMVQAFKKLNNITRLDVIAVKDNAGGTKATSTIAFTGAVSKTGEYQISIGSEFLYTATISLAVGNSASDIVTAVVEAFTALTNAPFTVVANGDDVDITAANIGTVGNSIGVSIDGLVQGVTNTFSKLSGGATDPIIVDLFSAIAGERYQTIIMSNVFSITDLANFLDARFNVENDILDGVAIVCIAGDISNMIVIGDTVDSKDLAIFANPENTALTHDLIFEMPDIVSSQFGAQRALRMTNNANITAILSGSVVGDTLGGAQMASRPYMNMPLPNLSLTPSDEVIIRGDLTSMRNAGLSFLGNNIARNSIISNEVRTTDKTDLTWLQLNTVDTASRIREFFSLSFRATFAQNRITDEDLIEDRPMQNINSIKSLVNELYSILSTSDFNLTVATAEALQIFKSNTIVTLDSATGFINITFNRVPIVTQVRGITSVVKIELVFAG